ncbi:MAG: type II secretion system major pseudopilin GspG, partial [Sedimentisphaerales bacterium]|nr:type II secretion system major pseudopilin GspG [Sedimentisphaerales bacterium]
MKRQRTRKHRRRGFTLVEMLVVVLIITMLATLIAPRVFKGFRKAKTNIARAKIAKIENALSEFYLDCGRLPSQSEGLDALLNPPSGVENWDGPYLKMGDIMDPWNHVYQYIPQSTTGEGTFT